MGKSLSGGAIRLKSIVAGSLWLALTFCADGQTIGKAAVVHNEVARVEGPKVTQIVVDESVFRNELVRTGTDGVTKLVFSDSTNLAVGPASTIRLDTFVFAGDGNYKRVTINLVRGAFRFTTGDSAKRAYKITTPVATIGVRGTVLDILSGSGRTVVTLVEHAAIVCTRNGAKCLTLDQPGDTVIVTANGIRRSSPGGSNGNDVCQQSPDICSPTRFASLPSPTQIAAEPEPDGTPDWSGFYVGGFGGYGGGASTQHDNGVTVNRAGVAVATPATVAATPAAATPAAATPAATTPGGSTFISADGGYGLGGGLYGGLVGYNFKVARFVVGVESDAGGSSIGGQSSVCGAPAHACGTSLGFAGDVRGRFGLPYRSMLSYVTGGVAFERVQAFDSLTGASGSSLRTGYVIGGGLEYKVTPSVSVRLEYLHSEFGAAHLFDIVPGVPEQVSAHSDVVHVGINIALNPMTLAQLGTGLR